MLKDSFRLPCCQYLRQTKLCDPFEKGHGKGCVLVFERVTAMYAITDIPVPVWNHYKDSRTIVMASKKVGHVLREMEFTEIFQQDVRIEDLRKANIFLRDEFNDDIKYSRHPDRSRSQVQLK